MQYICLTVGRLLTNCYIVYDLNNRGVVIDPGDNACRILNTVESNQLSIEHIILTHVHFDHMLAAGQVKDATSADLLVPAGDIQALNDSKRSLLFMSGLDSLPLKADGTFGHRDVIKAGQLLFTVIHTPGHTPGSCCFISGDLLFTGDTLLAGGFGRTDLGGDNRAMRSSLLRLSGLERDYTVLPGHGDKTTLEKERNANPYMSAL